MMTTNIEDPIYSAARKRRREWENIANKVKSLESKTPRAAGAKPYNMRDKKKSEPISPVDPVIKTFFFSLILEDI